jgi:hypothetical protein
MDWEKFKTLHTKVEDDFRSFLRFIQLSCCKACWVKQARDPQFKELEPMAWESDHHAHSSGGLLPILSQCRKLDETKFKNWVLDEEHGFVHGLITCFFAYMSLPDAVKESYKAELWNLNLEDYPNLPFTAAKFVVGCLFHDLIKSTTGINGNHDENLRSFYPGLPEIFYKHQEPTEMHPLVYGDRVELNRYSNVAEWGVQVPTSPEIEHFYRHLRPAVNKLVVYQSDPWISHFPECLFDYISVKYPEPDALTVFPPTSVNHNADCYSVGMGRIYATYWNTGCIQHYLHKILGIIPVKCSKSWGTLSCGNRATGGRDHPFFFFKDQGIPLKEWVFLCQNTEDAKLVTNQDTVLISQKTLTLLMIVVERLMCCIEAVCVN